MNMLYHSSPVLLEIGSVILPGNYGRVIGAVGEGHPHWERETELERVRSIYHPEKPSRLNSCFCCSNLESLNLYVEAIKKNSPNSFWPVIYEVEKVDPEAGEHRSDFNLVQPLPGLNMNMSQIAQKYWDGDFWIKIEENPSVRCEEVLTTSPIRITKRLAR